MDSLTLKWGTIKGWDFDSTECEAFKLLQEYMKDASISCAMDKPGKDRKKLLCKIIDKHNGEIWNDWEGTKMTAEEAKEYVMNYGN